MKMLYSDFSTASISTFSYVLHITNIRLHVRRIEIFLKMIPESLGSYIYLTCRKQITIIKKCFLISQSYLNTEGKTAPLCNIVLAIYVCA